MAFSDDGEHVISRGMGTISLRNVHRPVPKTIKYKGKAGFERLIISPNNEIFVTTGWENAIGFWNLATGELITELWGHTSSVDSACFSSDGQTLISRDRSTMRFWQVATQREIARFENEYDYPSPRLSPAKRLLDRSINGHVEFWRLAARTHEGRVP